MKKGFTLAEVLITLAVIGVVATLTLPNLIGNYQNRVLMTQLQKTINTVQNAVMKAMEESSAEDFLNLAVSDGQRREFLKKYFDTVNVCGFRTGLNNCLAPTYTSFDKTTSLTNLDVLYSFGMDSWYCATLASGATVCIGGSGFQTPEAADAGEYNVCRKFAVDVNGIKGPNVPGKDLFSFYIFGNGKINYNINTFNSYDDYMQYEASGETCTTSGIRLDYSGNVCLPYIISHGWQFKF